MVQMSAIHDEEDLPQRIIPKAASLFPLSELRGFGLFSSIALCAALINNDSTQSWLTACNRHDLAYRPCQATSSCSLCCSGYAHPDR